MLPVYRDHITLKIGKNVYFFELYFGGDFRNLQGVWLSLASHNRTRNSREQVMAYFAYGIQ